MANTDDALEIEIDELRTDQIDAGLLDTADSQATRAGHPPHSEAHIINRALWLFCSLENADQLMSEIDGETNPEVAFE